MGRLKGATAAQRSGRPQIKAAIDVELTKKGLTPVDDSDTGRLLIGYQAAVDTEKQYTSYDTGWGYGPGWYGGGWYGHGGGGMTTGTTSTITSVSSRSTCTPRARRARLARQREQDARSKAKPDKQQKNLAKAVAKLLKNYPPPIKK